MTHIERHDADFKIKNQAYNELQQINEHLANIENATPEARSKLQQLLTSVKDGSLGTLKLAKEIKDSEETVVWLIENAAKVSALLATLSI